MSELDLEAIRARAERVRAMMSGMPEPQAHRDLMALLARIAELERQHAEAAKRAEMLIRGIEAVQVIARQFAQEVLDAFEHEVPIGNETIEHARQLAQS